jgi:hypothetical protein
MKIIENNSIIINSLTHSICNYGKKYKNLIIAVILETEIEDNTRAEAGNYIERQQLIKHRVKIINHKRFKNKTKDNIINLKDGEVLNFEGNKGIHVTGRHLVEYENEDYCVLTFIENNKNNIDVFYN